jgi:lysyl-tRNA synthetase class 1
MPYQIPIRHLTNLLQTYNGDIDQTIAALPDVEEHQLDALKKRAECAWNWVSKYSPEEYRFALREPGSPPPAVDETESAALAALAAEVRQLEDHDEVSLSEAFYRIAEESGLSPADLFASIYRVLIGKEKGPRLAAFILSAGKMRVLPLLQDYEE